MMRQSNALVCLLALLPAATCFNHVQAQSLRQPSYPIFGILQTDPQLRGSAYALAGPDAFAPLCQYRMIYTSGGPALEAVRDGRKQAGCKPPVLFEDSYITPKGSSGKKGRKGGLQASFSPHRDDRWLRNVTNEADAARSGLRALCMIGPAGYVAAYINPALPNYDQLMRFSWCSFLLTVTKERSTWFGLPLLIARRDGETGFLPLPEICFVPIGDPVDSNEIGKLKLPNETCYLREFASGLVLVNPSSTSNPAVVDIPAGYVDWESKQPVSKVRLSAGDARLLLKP